MLFPLITFPVSLNSLPRYLLAVWISPLRIADLIFVELTEILLISWAGITLTEKLYVSPKFLRSDIFASLFRPNLWS